MTRYLVAPYLVQANFRGDRSIALPIDDIDGSGETLELALGNILKSMLDRADPYQEKADPNKDYLITEVHAVSGEAYLVTVEPGRRGMRSTVRKPSGNQYLRQVGDTEYTPLRHLIYFPKHGHSAIIFAERFGRYGAMTFLRNCFVQVLREKYEALTFHIDPMTTLEALDTATYKNLIFKAPRKKDSSGRFLDYAPQVGIDLAFKARRRVKSLTTRDSLGNDRIDAKKVFGVLRTEGPDAGISAPTDTKGWEASLTVEMDDGLPKTFKIDSDGPALVYPINGATINGTKIGSTRYPSTDEYLAVCQSIVMDIAGQYSLTTRTKLPPEVDLKPWSGVNATPWDVTYYDNP
ncbi:hypothetical protein [Arthrobacter sp. YD2]|uniref:hypothetical protein n=1 Tax=Arthrobacter sp. YD2 TaxID=3058046 RepID=UPI0025B3212D|nr:hypothetical protein [Arthrobacter sp. YD2]MDN3905554.1 hypothetical protein [Arthrobacter sp. YD2]